MEAPGHEQLSLALAAWYEAHKRPLPWRTKPADGYAVWVSEVMLQQTQVSTVVAYFQRWMQRFPSLLRLADATEHDVLSAWQGLGYYSRARALRNAAQILRDEQRGELPRRVEDLLKLPGIGRYTAGAIASIAFEVPAPIVDGNVERVLCRVHGLTGNPRRAPLQAALWQHAAQLHGWVPPSTLNQALMELGALICTPKTPDCARCPLSKLCVAQQHGLQARLPALPKRPPPIETQAFAAFALRAGRVLLTKRETPGVPWRGLWHLPQTDHTAARPQKSQLHAVVQAAGVRLDLGEPVAQVLHSITKYRVTLQAHRASVRGRLRPHDEQWRWCPVEDLAELPVPAPHRRLLRRLLAEVPTQGRSRTHLASPSRPRRKKNTSSSPPRK